MKKDVYIFKLRFGVFLKEFGDKIILILVILHLEIVYPYLPESCIDDFLIKVERNMKLELLKRRHHNMLMRDGYLIWMRVNYV
jgi:hypothetical protein